MTVALMWEARAVARPGRRAAGLGAGAHGELARTRRCAARPSAPRRTGCWSSPGGTRRTTRDLPELPEPDADLIARPVHRWRFEVAGPEVRTRKPDRKSAG